MRGPQSRLVLGAAVGDCVHVAGVLHFLNEAARAGYETEFLGPAQSVEALAQAVERLRPHIVGVSYRLSPETAAPLFAELAAGKLGPGGASGERRRPWLVFGGTAPVCRVAAGSGVFSAVFSPESPPGSITAFLRRAAAGFPGEPGLDGLTADATAGAGGEGHPVGPPGTLIERVAAARPYPIFRHHFGQPTLEATVEGCARLAESGLIDVISIGPDQNTQERFFRPEEIDEAQTGAGGVPLRRPEDFAALFAASRRGNYPLMRCYSGTRDILRMARVLVERINNAWCAVPLYWYNVLDARSDRPLRESIPENMEVVTWHAERGVPVEINESHHWSLREAPDAVAVAAAFLAAYNAKKRGVRYYVSQYMFNTPAGTLPDTDLGKMLAKIDLIEALHDEGFTSLREVRAGLASFPADPAEAKGHLAASTYLQMALAPHILHVVGYSEADHAARPEEIIESLKVCRGVVRAALEGLPDMSSSASVRRRREELVSEAQCVLDGLRELAGPDVPDPWTDTETLARAVEVGLFDSPHLAGNPAALGRVRTKIMDGMCLAIDPDTGRPVPEKQRVKEALDRAARWRGAGGHTGGASAGRS